MHFLSLDNSVYNEFILSLYICPLIFPRRCSIITGSNQEKNDFKNLFQLQEDHRVLKLGLLALSHFSAPDILSNVFPESPKILASILFDEDGETINLCQMEEWQYVLSKIISHEIKNLNRGLFKGVGRLQHSTGSGSDVSEFQKNKQIIISIGNKIVSDWESGVVNPGLRVGYALASLVCYQSSVANEHEPAVQEQEFDLKSTRFYKLMVNAIQDITLTDHWIIRLSIVLEWWNFFEMGLREILPIPTTNEYHNNQDEIIIKALWEDLMKRLDDAKFPVTFQNIILSLSGILSNLIYLYSKSYISGLSNFALV